MVQDNIVTELRNGLFFLPNQEGGWGVGNVNPNFFILFFLKVIKPDRLRCMVSLPVHSLTVNCPLYWSVEKPYARSDQTLFISLAQ